MILTYLLQKEFLQIFRNRFIPKLIIAFPVVIMCVMPWVMNMEVKNIRVEVVDNDHSTLSRELINDIGASNHFILTSVSTSYQSSLNNIEHNITDIVITIPPHYQRDLECGLKPRINIAANAVNGTKGSIGSTCITQIINRLIARHQSVNTSKVAPQTNVLYNKYLNYKVFMIPALFAIIVMLICGFLPTLNIVSEKEKGTIEQINVTPVLKWQFITAKIIPYWLIALFIVSECLLLSWLLYDISCVGNIVLIYLLTATLALFFSSFGLIISNYSDNLQQAMFVMWFFVVILLLLSGLFTPVNSMPQWAFCTTYVNPVHYFIDAIRTVFVRGGNFGDIFQQWAILLIIGLTTALWAILSYRKNA